MSDSTKGAYDEWIKLDIKTPKPDKPKPKQIIRDMKGERVNYTDHAPKGGVSPRGDLGTLSDHERKAFFPKSIKNSGGTLSGTSHLPYRKPATAIDPQFGPGDKIS